MRTSDFHFELPPELIAQHPTAERSASRLLVIDRTTGEISDRHFTDILDYLTPQDTLVFNDTRVIPARLYGNKASGGKVEILVERVLNDHQVLAHVRASKSPKPGSSLLIGDDGDRFEIEVSGREDDLFLLRSIALPFSRILQDAGHMPLPPYIERADDAVDQERYQTVYAARPGAVAAPTAGLHFDDCLLRKIDTLGALRQFVTLHVGAGTFQPVRAENIEEHRMHSEYLEVSQQVADECRSRREQGGRIIAVGTTSVRCLESASAEGSLDAYQGDTDIFIYPGYEFRSVDAMITNFHLPESTLLMLVSAFADRELMLRAYRHAVEQKYRFFSYGDAMLIL